MDLKALGEGLGLDEDEFIEIVEIFIESACEDVERLKEALLSKNPENASAAAHSLKGSAANLGFMDIAGLAAQLENEAGKKKITGIEEALPQLNDMLAQIRALM